MYTLINVKIHQISIAQFYLVSGTAIRPLIPNQWRRRPTATTLARPDTAGHHHTFTGIVTFRRLRSQVFSSRHGQMERGYKLTSTQLSTIKECV